MIQSKTQFYIVLSAAMLISVGFIVFGNNNVSTIFSHTAAAFEGELAYVNKAPIVTSDDNVYVTWWTNKTGNDEVIFRASNDGGLTFGDKINLSNTTDIESVDAEIAADGENVYVTWWERNENVHPHTNDPVLRISTDGGQTFGSMLNLAANGTIKNNQE